ncbi:tetratricopeptide repeat protein [Thalassospira marina]|uniref:Tetratricopeptide repeat protein n=1 Tax=Thalassospira marina TaxID=2048283 RepID=A0ABN5FE52_9PROT|nr:tetratricopeptide repeat protein [Thalassospira marina]AUG52185.1 hypothetical protein CSC3H3_05185 [Thalassospira marina]
MAQPQPVFHTALSRNGQVMDLAPETRSRLRQMIDDLPDIPARLRVMGHGLLDMGLVDLALECFGRALLADDLDDATHLGLVRTYLLKGNRDQAVAHLEIAISLRPEMRDLRVILADLLCNSLHLRRALDQLAQVLADEPGHAGARRGLANILHAFAAGADKTARHDDVKTLPSLAAPMAMGSMVAKKPVISGGVMVWQEQAASQIEVKRHNGPAQAWYWCEPTHPATRP